MLEVILVGTSIVISAVIIYVISSVIGILVALKIMDMQMVNVEKEFREIYLEIHNGGMKEGEGNG